MASRHQNSEVSYIPQSTETKIVFPYLKDEGEFDTSLHATIMSQHKVSKDRVEAFFQRLKEAADDYQRFTEPEKGDCCLLLNFSGFLIVL